MPKLNLNRDPIRWIEQHFYLECGTELRQHLDGNDEFRQHREVFVRVEKVVSTDFATKRWNKFQIFV